MSKFMSFIFLGIMVSMSFIIPQQVHAATLYDNGPSTHSGGSSIGQFIAADDFVFDTNVMISGVSVDVSDGPSDVGDRYWDGTVEWWILDDNGGAPGNVIASGVGHNIMQTKLDVSSVGSRDFTVYFHFGQTIPMTAGQTYWLALHFQADYTRMSVFWDFNDSVRNNVSYSSGQLVGGVPDFTSGGPSPHDKAFRLTHRGYVLYDNGPSTHSGGSSIGLYIAADDFVFTSDAVITGASVDVSDGPASDGRLWDGTVEWWILDDNGGAPGNVIASGPGRNITQIDVVTSALGFRDFTVDFDFGRRIAVTAGQPYWLALHFQEDYSRMSVVWDFTDTPSNNLSYSSGELIGGVPDFTSGGPSPHDKAFRLTRYDTATCPAGDTTDTDGDGLFDCWETNGIDSDGDGTIDLELYDVDGDGVIEDDPNGDGNTDDTERADPQHRDLYMEVDWMAQHQPVAAAVNRVINSFANAPVNNPDGTQGIRLHIQADEQALAHNDVIAFAPCTGPAGTGVPDFDDVKTTHFGTAAERADPNTVNLLNAKRMAFHYVLFVHNLLGKGFVSGCAELPGNDFVVSLGGYLTPAGNLSANPADGPHWAGVDHHDSTLMHEFGHNLNLRHGGSDNFNCKPNYLSIMSYCRQFDNQPIVGRPLDYSREALDPLDETDLSEPAGIGGPAGDQTAFGPTPVQVVPADQPINWNRDADSTDTGVSADINDHGFDGCRGYGEYLAGFNDWANLQYNLRDSVDFADGVHLTVSDEIRLDEAARVSPDSDSDGIVNLLDNCPFVANSDQADLNGNGFGDACEPVANAGPDQTVECAGPTVTPVHLDGSGSYDPGGDLLTFNWTWSGGFATGMNPTIELPLGSHTITLVVTDGFIDSEPDTVNITVVDTTPPVITPPPDVTVECLGSAGQTVDIGVATATDACCITGVTPVNDAPSIFYLGMTVITWTATDCHGNTGTATQKVTVQDTTPPELSVSISPDMLWPPNHRMVEVVPTITTSDVCCGTHVTVELVSVVSDEPDTEDTFDASHDIEAASGHQGGDIQILDGRVFLRAERAGKGDGRVYTLTYRATDCAGNTTAESVTVTVPHDQR